MKGAQKNASSSQSRAVPKAKTVSSLAKKSGGNFSSGKGQKKEGSVKGVKGSAGHTQRKRKSVAPPTPVVPTASQPVSSNWKALAQKLPKGSSRKRRRVDPTADGASSVSAATREDLSRASGAAAAPRAGKAAAAPRPEDLWFDGVSEEDLVRTLGPAAASVEAGAAVEEVDDPRKRQHVLKRGSFTGETKHVAMDCEMVGTGATGKASIVARCSIVNMHGHVLYDSFVKAQERVTDYRTHVSGVRPNNLKEAPTFEVMQKEVSKLLKGKILVGHALRNDFKVLLLSHPKRDIRDTSRYRPFRNKYAGGRAPGLKKLARELLGIDIQKGEHSSVTDAQATMALYLKVRKDWESGIREKKKGAMTGKTNTLPGDAKPKKIPTVPKE